MKGGGRNQVQCEFDKGLGHGKVCAVDVQSWGPCAPSANYSYNRASPCFFLKLNKVCTFKIEHYQTINILIFLVAALNKENKF